MDNKPDFKNSYILANELLVAARCITAFPFEVRELVKEQIDLGFCSFKKAREKYGLNCHDLGSDSAILARQNGKNIIFYNQDEYDAREPFNMLHECGHFLKRHKTNLKKDDPLYGIQEVEANYFAAQMLMPLPVLKEIQRRGYRIDVSYLMKHFGVSEPAAKRRIKTLNQGFYQTEEEKMFDDIIVEKFKKFIDRIAPKRIEEYNSCWDDPMQEERDSWY